MEAKERFPPHPFPRKPAFHLAKFNANMNSTTTLEKEYISNWSAVRIQRTFHCLSCWRNLQ